MLNTKSLVGLAALALAVSVPGLAAAQDGLAGDTVGEADTFDGTSTASDLLGAHVVCDDPALTSFVSVSRDESSDQTTDQSVELDEDTVLLGIALANNGFGDVGFDQLASTERTTTLTADRSTETDVDEDDAFSAIAIGATGGASNEALLACASDVDESATVTMTESREVALDEDSVLLAIAVARNLDQPSFDDVADLSESRSTETSVDRDVAVDRDDALLLLAFG